VEEEKIVGAIDRAQKGISQYLEIMNEIFAVDVQRIAIFKESSMPFIGCVRDLKRGTRRIFRTWSAVKGANPFLTK